MFKQRLTELFSLERIKYLIQNPRENPQETVLMVGIVIILPLILLTAVLLVYSIIKRPPEEKKKGMNKKLWTIVGILLISCLFVFAIFSLIYSSQPSYCHSCHEMRKEYTSWKKSSHKNVTCLSCHQEPGITNWAIMKIQTSRMTYLNMTKKYPKPIVTKVSDLSCIQCHSSLDVQQISHYGIKMSHKEPLKAGFRCNDCHNTVGHGKVTVEAHYPSMNDCIECHNSEKTSTKCSTCHTKDVGVKPRAQVVDYPKVHLEPPTDCRGCHPIEKCNACHGLEMPHPPGFAQSEVHGKLAAFEKKKLCFKCHAENGCGDCHIWPSGHPDDWKKTHGPAAQGPVAREGCLGCHDRSKDFCRLCH